MKKRQSSIDGFVTRRPGSVIGEQHDEHFVSPRIDPVDRNLHTGENLRETVGAERTGKGIGRSDIDASLRDIDDDVPVKKLSRRQRKRLAKNAKPKSKTKRIIKWVFIFILLACIGIGIYVGVKGLNLTNNIFQGNIFDIVQNEPLKKDVNGRSNFLIFGTAEDDEGGEHGGANLTDSIMVLSIDQDKKDAFMISLPRDLWVSYAETCTVGNQGKLNAAYFCASDDGLNEAAGAAALQAQVGEILGLDLQYYIHLNFTAVVEAVDAVGGVDVTIESEDPRGILDRNFDWKCGYKCYYVNYKNGETVHLDGEHALALARARNASGGYGLPGGNFDREKNQQKVIKALREKAVSAGTLTNLGKVTGLMDALGKNLHTNIETKEIRTLMALGTDIKTENIRSLTLVDENALLVTTGDYNGQSIVRPVAGISDFSGIQAYIKKNASTNALEREAAPIVVLNGTDVSGVAQTEADSLKTKGYTISLVDSAPDGTYAAVEVYQIGGGNSETAKQLTALYGVTIKTTTPPISVDETVRFVVVIGAVRQ